MMRINTIWEELENDISFSARLLLRRYAAYVLPDIYVAVKFPERLRTIALRFGNDKQVNTTAYSDLRDIRIEAIPDERDSAKQFLLIMLVSQIHSDVFAVLCEDLINEVAATTDEQQVIRYLLNRLEKWKALFHRASLEGLTPEEQRGLFGELCFIRKWLSFSQNTQKVIRSWVGPEKAIRDFQLENWALEVKTTHSNNHQKLHISSERQLDTVNLNSLILYHLSLETRQLSGETLNQVADFITELLNTDISARSQFRAKLLQTGYFPHQRALYEDTGYQIRQEQFYRVRDDFPRIEEQDVRSGVGDVKYTIILSDFSDYTVTEPEVFEIIN